MRRSNRNLTKNVFKSWGQTDKSDDRVGHLDTTLVQGGGNLNSPIFKSLNARGLPGKRGEGMLKFPVDRRITGKEQNLTKTKKKTKQNKTKKRTKRAFVCYIY